MPSTVNVNFRSVAHATSVGISTAFPDVCKTPSPAGPVPIPYPNIGMSADTDGTGTVKADGSSCMVKGANFRLSSGDEAGAAMGVVSNKIKGAAEFLMYSFDVKFEGKNVCRLTDPMQQNMGSANALSPAEMQAMLPGLGSADAAVAEACKRAAKKVNKTRSDAVAAPAWEASGIVGEHRQPILDTVTELNLKVIFRTTKKLCAPWITQKYQPKPHDIIAGTTITPDSLKHTVKWLDAHDAARIAALMAGALDDFDLKHAGRDRLTGKELHRYETAVPPGTLGAATAEAFIGIVGSTKDGADKGRPLLANVAQGAQVPNSYVHKYVTGDYDLYDVLIDRDPSCRRPLQKGNEFHFFQRMANTRMRWDGIQHGPQSQWVAVEKKSNEEEGDFASFSLPLLLQGWLKAKRGTPVTQVPIAEGRKLNIIDEKMTVVTARGASSINSNEEAWDYLVCCGCREPGPGVGKEPPAGAGGHH